MYLATMWSYFSGFFAVVYLIAPILFIVFGWLPVRAFSREFLEHLIPFLVVNQALFLVVGWGRPTWRGQQYSLALFPLWSKAISSTIRNVYFGQPLGFVVTPKVRQGGASLQSQWPLVWPQLLAIGLLVLAAIW